MDIFHLVLLSVLLSGCKGEDHQISMLYWGDYESKIFTQRVTVGEAPFNILDIKEKLFCLDKCAKDDSLSYPSGPDYPRVSILDEVSSIKYLVNPDSEVKKNESKVFIEGIINNDTGRKDFQLVEGISWFRTTGNTKVLIQIVIVWNAKKTYLIVAVNELPNDISNMFMTLGRGLGSRFIVRDIVKTGRTVFEISSKNIIRLGCVDVREAVNNGPLHFSMDPGYISNMGGELVTLTGPCLLDPIPKIESMKIFPLQNKERSSIAYLSVADKQSNTIQFVTPFVWYHGLYVFTFTYGQFVFETEAEIYPLAESNSSYSVVWTGSSEMNNPNFNASEVNLSINGFYDSVTFNVLRLADNQIKTLPFTASKPSPIFTIQTASLVDITFDVRKDIGFFSIRSTSSRNLWSAPFSLIWLQAFKKAYKSVEENCFQFIITKASKTTSYCPDYSKKAQSIPSTFQRFKPQSDLQTLYSNIYDCFVQNTVNDVNEEGQSKGRTCCYSKDGSLMYGQDFYLRDDKLAASYGWTYSPIFNKLEHFLYDQVPLLLCCSLIKNDELCSRYWEVNNVTQSQNFTRDYTGNVIGDPHFIPFNSLSSYTLLSKGEYWLIKGKPNTFQLQGRFYSSNSMMSTLKAISFTFDSYIVIITTRWSFNPLFQWNILINNNSVSLPYTGPGLSISQNDDTSKLSVYVKVSKVYFAHMELKRLKTFRQNEEYLNLKTDVSNNFEEIVVGGLFGRAENNASSSGLYTSDTIQMVPHNSSSEQYFNFSKTWQLKSQNESFFYSKNEFEKINSKDFWVNISVPTSNLCGGIVFCDIDKNVYGGDNVWRDTKQAYEERIQYNKEVSEVDFDKKMSCGHPGWQSVVLNSSSFVANSSVKVIKCRDNETLKFENIVITCHPSSMTWTPNDTFGEPICVHKATVAPIVHPKGDNNIWMYVVISVAIIVLVSIVIFSIIIYRRQKNEPKITKSEISVTSQDPLHSQTSIPMDDVYDTWQPNPGPPEIGDYAVYSHIKKPMNTKK